MYKTKNNIKGLNTENEVGDSLKRALKVIRNSQLSKSNGILGPKIKKARDWINSSMYSERSLDSKKMGSYSAPAKMMKHDEDDDESRHCELSLEKPDPFPPSFFVLRRRQIKRRGEKAEDYISKLPDEMILIILKSLPKETLGRFKQTCKRFLRLASDETLWPRIDMMGKNIFNNNLGVLMSRKPVYLRLARATTLGPTAFDVKIGASQLTYLDISSLVLSTESLEILLGMCTNLRKLSLEQLAIPPSVLAKMEVFTHSINTLNMTMCTKLQAGPLSEYLSKCNRLNALNLGCIVQNWTSENLMLLMNSLGTEIEFLNLAGFKNHMLDDHVEVLIRKCPDLIDLDLSDCQQLTGITMSMLTALQELQHLALNRCYKIERGSIVFLQDMRSLKCLEIFQLFDTDYDEFSRIVPNLMINLYLFSSIARPTVGDKHSSIWNQLVNSNQH